MLDCEGIRRGRVFVVAGVLVATYRSIPFFIFFLCNQAYDVFYPYILHSHPRVVD